MLPNPIHPAVVHFPVVFVFLVPIFALAALWAIRRGARPLRAWALPLAMASALTLSAWVSVQTGEAQENRVENVVAKSAFETHEEAAKLFMVLSAVLLVVVAAGFLDGTPGRSARVVATLGALGLIVAGVRVGHSGGQLVYEHGAASAYSQAAPSTGGDAERPTSIISDESNDDEGE
jgi:uncharacterized membrane protein